MTGTPSTSSGLGSGRYPTSPGGTCSPTSNPAFGEGATMTTLRALPMRTLLALAAGLTASTALTAQAPSGAPGAPPRKPLPLEVGRHADFTETKGTWISLDVSP